MSKKIDIHKNFIRDENSGVILNKDKSAFLNRKALKKRLKADKDERQTMASMIEDMQKRLNALEKPKRVNKKTDPN